GSIPEVVGNRSQLQHTIQYSDDRGDVLLQQRVRIDDVVAIRPSNVGAEIAGTAAGLKDQSAGAVEVLIINVPGAVVGRILQDQLGRIHANDSLAAAENIPARAR